MLGNSSCTSVDYIDKLQVGMNLFSYFTKFYDVECLLFLRV